MNHSLILAASSVLTCSLVLSACSHSPVAPTTGLNIVTPPPSSVPAPSAPKAILSIGRGENPPLAIADFTPLLFDASLSTGDALTYRIDFGDGTSSTDGATTHVAKALDFAGWRYTATLTVTDSLGRTDSVSQQYYVMALSANGIGTLWGAADPAGILSFNQDGGNVTGWWSYGTPKRADQPRPSERFSGALTADRTLTLRTEKGVEIKGIMEWSRAELIDCPCALALRMSMRGGPYDGRTFDFRFSDPY